MSLRTFVNADSQPRVWPQISAPAGHTLALDAGETVDLDLPADFEDAFLTPVDDKTKRAAPAAQARSAPSPPPPDVPITGTATEEK